MLTAVVARPPVFGGTVKSVNADARPGRARREGGGPGPVRRRGDRHLVLGGQAGPRCARGRLGRGRGRRGSTRRHSQAAYAELARDARPCRQARGRCGRRACRGGHAARGGLPDAVPGARADGAPELPGRAGRGPVRHLDRHPVPDGGPRQRRRGGRAQARAGAHPHARSSAGASAGAPCPAPTSSSRRCTSPRPPGRRSRPCGPARTTSAAATTGRCGTRPLAAGLDAGGAAGRPGSTRSSASRSSRARRSRRRSSRTASTRRRSRARPSSRTRCPNVTVELHSPKGPVPGAVVALGRPHAYRLRGRELHRRARPRGGQGSATSTAGRCSPSQPRHLGVLDLAAQKANWGGPLTAGRARGIAVHESFGSWCAQVAEVSVQDRRRPGPSRRLRDRLRPAGQPGDDPGADGGRHRVRPVGRAVRRRSR